MDNVAAELTEPVLIQRGYTTYVPQRASFFDFVPMSQATEYIRSARVVVSHAGIGTVILCRKYRIPLIIVPRLRRFKEHNSDHQLEIAQAVAGFPGVKTVYDVSTLREAIETIEPPPPGEDGQNPLLAYVARYAESIAGSG